LLNVEPIEFAAEHFRQPFFECANIELVLVGYGLGAGKVLKRISHWRYSGWFSGLVFMAQSLAFHPGLVT
jgi:hypothetical protein